MMKFYRKKSILLLLSILTVVMASATSVSAAKAQTAVTVQVNNKQVSFPDAKPYTEGDRVMIPVRFVSESLRAKVGYKKETAGLKVNRVVTIEIDNKKIKMNVNSDTVLVGEKIVKLDVPARIQKERVYVPLRFVSEALGAQVQWDQKKHLVSITTGKVTDDPSKEPGKGNPGDENMYGKFEFKQGYTDLAKSLFVSNMAVSNGKLNFTLPNNATGTYFTAKGAMTKLIPGKQYAYEIGQGKGFVSISLVYQGKGQIEGYSVFMDSKDNSDLASLFGNITNDAIVSGDSKNGINADTLSNVIAAAKALK